MGRRDLFSSCLLICGDHMQKNLFSARGVAVMGVLTAISYVLYILPKFIPTSLPIFPSWLDLQISDLPALLGGFALGPVASIIIITVKCLLKLPFTTSLGIGELADFIVGVAFVFPATLIYNRNKSKKSALIGMTVGALAATFAACIANRFILIPFYAGFYGKGDGALGMSILVGAVSKLYSGVTTDNFFAYYLFLAVVPFNLLRCLITSAITYFIYKPLSKYLH